MVVIVKNGIWNETIILNITIEMRKRVKIYVTRHIKPIALYGSETWTLNKNVSRTWKVFF